jgi:hypothetical protein|tara:strand:- start:3842 stop:4060 length:219 start_codon:yes stop_codon:yes gene_type:complete
MAKFKVITSGSKKIKLDSDQVIQALANYLVDEDMLHESEHNGTMHYHMTANAGITIELLFDQPDENKNLTKH